MKDLQKKEQIAIELLGDIKYFYVSGEDWNSS